MLPHKQIESRLQQAVRAVLPDADLATVLVRPCPDLRFGDYQTSAIMALAKPRKLNPRQLATDVLARLDLRDLCEPVEIAGGGSTCSSRKPPNRARSLWTSVRRTSPSRCTWGTFARRFWATVSRVCCAC
ncbi:MAG: hypothetical protein DMF60_00400 [Acidobacteria bacterium]|nr:MAG: hypothetical protein DMF60_00400 [Acidobacteriota bacterium]